MSSMPMTSIRSSLLLSALIALAGCVASAPFVKPHYVGEWQGETDHLSITQQGYVRYERGKGWRSSSLEGRLKGFKGDDIEVGFGPIASTIVVNKPPYLDGDVWKMVVDGKELIRISIE